MYDSNICLFVKASLLGFVRYPRPRRVIKVEVGGGKIGRQCTKPGESKGRKIAESDPLENNNEVLELNAFVCLILITGAIPQDKHDRSG